MGIHSNSPKKTIVLEDQCRTYVLWQHTGSPRLLEVVGGWLNSGTEIVVENEMEMTRKTTTVRFGEIVLDGNRYWIDLSEAIKSKLKSESKSLMKSLRELPNPTGAFLRLVPKTKPA